MTETSGDGWAAGDAYDAYMGRWSRLIAGQFLDWLGLKEGGHWLEVGCGTGALTATLFDHRRPASVVACDTSAAFIEHARKSLPPASEFEVISGANALPSRPGGFDAVVSGLVLNFVADPSDTLGVMRARTRAGGTVAAYVWDYGGGMELLKYFWEEAVSLSADAASLDEGQRFRSWDAATMEARFRSAGLADVQATTLDIPTTFASFDDYWKPFLGRSGPAPSYVASLEPAQRELLRTRLERRLRPPEGQPIELRARALAARGTAT